MTKKALIIGMNIDGLKYAEEDAELVNSCFKLYGFDTVLIKTNDITEDTDILKVINKLSEDCSDKSDVFMFYFSGHFVHSDKNYNMSFIINENEKSKSSRLGANILHNYLDDVEAKKIIILDCCYAANYKAVADRLNPFSKLHDDYFFIDFSHKTKELSQKNRYTKRLISVLDEIRGDITTETIKNKLKDISYQGRDFPIPSGNELC